MTYPKPKVNDANRLRLKDRSLYYRYPRASVIIGTTLGLLIFYSKPLYDLFFAEKVPYVLKKDRIKNTSD